jgi:hypothetical protein
MRHRAQSQPDGRLWEEGISFVRLLPVPSGVDRLSKASQQRLATG